MRSKIHLILCGIAKKKIITSGKKTKNCNELNNMSNYLPDYFSFDIIICNIYLLRFLKITILLVKKQNSPDALF